MAKEQKRVPKVQKEKVDCKTYCESNSSLNERDKYFLNKKYAKQLKKFSDWEEIIIVEKLDKRKGKSDKKKGE